MTIDLNRWSAELMEWTVTGVSYYNAPTSPPGKYVMDIEDWTPLTNANHLKMVIEQVVELGWNVEVFWTGKGEPQAHRKPISAYVSKFYHCFHAIGDDLNTAVLQAAYEAMKEN